MPLTVAHAVYATVGILTLTNSRRGEPLVRPSVASLLELDPDLGQLLTGRPPRGRARELRVAVHTIDTGPWDVEACPAPARTTSVCSCSTASSHARSSSRTRSAPSCSGPATSCARGASRTAPLCCGTRSAGTCSAAAGSRCSTAASRPQLGRSPEVNAAIIDRLNERALRLAVTQAISQLNRVDRRLLALFWHLAERWGRMTRRRGRAADDALAPACSASWSAPAGRPSRPRSASSPGAASSSAATTARGC